MAGLGAGKARSSWLCAGETYVVRGAHELLGTDWRHSWARSGCYVAGLVRRSLAGARDSRSRSNQRREKGRRKEVGERRREKKKEEQYGSGFLGLKKILN